MHDEMAVMQEEHISRHSAHLSKIMRDHQNADPFTVNLPNDGLD